jgi:hypothetical protein
MGALQSLERNSTAYRPLQLLVFALISPTDWFACLFSVWRIGRINRALAFLYVHLISASVVIILVWMWSWTTQGCRCIRD